ncbi:hypothetical protein BJY59DRAFT_6125 [Rhodotorula toruloides]
MLSACSPNGSRQESGESRCPSREENSREVRGWMAPFPALLLRGRLYSTVYSLHEIYKAKGGKRGRRRGRTRDLTVFTCLRLFLPFPRLPRQLRLSQSILHTLLDAVETGETRRACRYPPRTRGLAGERRGSTKGSFLHWSCYFLIAALVLDDAVRRHIRRGPRCCFLSFTILLFLSFSSSASAACYWGTRPSLACVCSSHRRAGEALTLVGRLDGKQENRNVVRAEERRRGIGTA